MKNHWVICVLLSVFLFTAGYLLGQTPAVNPLAPYIPQNMKPYYLDLLLKTDKPEPAISAAENATRMQKHLGYIRSQAEAGNFVLVGPITEDARVRGIAVIQATTLDDAKRIASGDPLVQAGHLQVEVHPILLEDLSSVKFDFPGLK